MTSAAGHVRFDTAALPPRDRFEYWRARVQPLRLEPLGAARTDFRVAADMLRSGDATVIEMSRGPALARWRRAGGARQGRLRLILLAPSPGATACWYEHEVTLEHGYAVLSADNDGWWRAPAGMRGIEVDIPRASVDVADAALARFVENGFLARDPIFRSLIRPMLAGMSGTLAALATVAGTDLGTGWVSLLAMLVRSMSGRDLDGADLAPARRVQAQRYIRAHLADPRLSPDGVAAALHLSRRALYATAFPEDGGVARYIRGQRLARAHRLLTATAVPIGVIAAQVGLPDLAHFGRLFRAEYGCSPSELRAQHVAPVPLRVAPR